MKKYFPKDIEKKWQDKWKESGIYATNLSKTDQEKFYVLAEYAYPSGDLHMGHWFTWSGADVFARFKRMQGYNVFFPNGFDSFGLPAEGAAIKRNIHPQDWTEANISRMKEQYMSMGPSFEFYGDLASHKPDYYKWNQWIFLKMFERGIAYKGKYLSNWCPVDQTVLANEAVEGGKCWRCGSEVEQKEISQWFFKITEYADRLLWENTDKEVSNGVRWPVSVRSAQNEWIGKSEGLIFTSPVKHSDMKIQTFSTHFEAFYADTFVVIAPDHPLLDELIKDVPNKDEIKKFANDIVNKRIDRDYGDEKEIEGIFTGKYVVDPIGNGDLPIWVASFALKDYGTGIVKCSAHDLRDFTFAKKYGIRLKPVIFPEDEELKRRVEKLEVCYTDMQKGILSEPSEFAGKRAGDVRKEIADFAVEKGFAEKTTQYHLHDWSVSRQRYWGTPVPMIHCPKDGIVPVPETDLPVLLPYDVDFQPKGKPPLASNLEWLKVKCPKCGEPAEREAETMDAFVDSSWYFFRYLDTSYNKGPFDIEIAKKIMPVDIYFGGAEHTLGHTLYSRFFTKFFKDLTLSDIDEYALRRINHGTILGPDGSKMSKSRPESVVNPDEEVKKYGADTIRLYLAFLMPYEATGPWDRERVNGPYRFLQRIWGLVDKIENSGETDGGELLSQNDLRQMHKTIKNVSEDIEGIRFNTAVAFLMQYLNYLSSKDKILKIEYKTLLKLLAPFAPHITEELWQVVSSQSSAVSENKWSIHQQDFPKFDEKYLIEEEVVIVVQVNGKVRENFVLPKTADEQTVLEKARSSEKVSKFLIGDIKKTIFVPGKILNIVV